MTRRNAVGILAQARRALTVRLTWALSAIAACALIVAPSKLSRASDHADTAENVNRIGADLTDVFIFPSVENPSNVILVMNVRGLIPTGQGSRFGFDPGVLHQFRIDNTGDFVEDLVIQARFSGFGARQGILFAGPAPPNRVGTISTPIALQPGLGATNTSYSPGPGLRVFAGAREDPFFFDLERFYAIFPDRQTPLSGQQIDFPQPNAPRFTSWRPLGQARDYLAGFNVLSIIVEVPRAQLGGGRIQVWATTSIQAPDGTFRQQDRLARPVVNEALATVSRRRHEVNNKDNPTDDAGQLEGDIRSFLTFPAGRSQAIQNVLAAVLVPDVLVADLREAGPAAYLGVETGGATGGKFGGRKLEDDVVDISLGAIFGNTVPALGLAPDDGQAIPSLVSDNVGSEAKHFLPNFPYLGNPR